MSTRRVAGMLAVFAASPGLGVALPARSRDTHPGTPARAPGHPLVQLGDLHFDWRKGLASVDAFLDVYAARPDKSNVCGMRLSHSYALWALVRELQPETIVESGVNGGHSTYVMRAAAPHARIVSLDPLTKPICGQQPKRWINATDNVYKTGAGFKDFSKVNWTAEIPNTAKALAFFDDHQNAYDRIPVLKRHGFKHAIFEDNYGPGEGDAHSLKQVLSGTGAEADHLVEQLSTYDEFPPLFYYLPGVSLAQRPGRKHRTCFLDPGTRATFREPLVRPDLRAEDEQLLEKFERRLNFTVAHDYDEFMMYCNIAYVTLK